MINTVPTLSLGKKSKEALEYYKSVGLIVMGDVFYFGKKGMGEQPGFDENDIAFAALAVGDMQATIFLMAGQKDMHLGNISVMYENNPEDTKKLETFYGKLMKESNVLLPLSIQNWDTEYYYAYVIDKFGIHWNLTQRRG